MNEADKKKFMEDLLDDIIRDSEDQSAPEPAPVYKTAGIGFRFWTVDRESKFKFRLGSVGRGNSYWGKGVLKASCAIEREYVQSGISKESHKSPGANCDCGFYSFHSCPSDHLLDLAEKSYEYEIISLRDLLQYERIFGALRYAGDVQEHADGVRAEQTEIIALYFPRFKKKISRENYMRRLYLHRLVAWNYRIPLFRDRQKFLEYVANKGEIRANKETDRRIDSLANDYANGVPHLYRGLAKRSSPFILPLFGITLIVALVIALSGWIISGTSDVESELNSFREGRDALIAKIIDTEESHYHKTGEYITSSEELEQNSVVSKATEALAGYDKELAYELNKSGDSLYITVVSSANASSNGISGQAKREEFRTEIYRGKETKNASTTEVEN